MFGRITPRPLTPNLATDADQNEVTSDVNIDIEFGTHTKVTSEKTSKDPPRIRLESKKRMENTIIKQTHSFPSSPRAHREAEIERKEAVYMTHTETILIHSPRGSSSNESLTESRPRKLSQRNEVSFSVSPSASAADLGQIAAENTTTGNLMMSNSLGLEFVPSEMQCSTSRDVPNFVNEITHNRPRSPRSNSETNPPQTHHSSLSFNVSPRQSLSFSDKECLDNTKEVNCDQTSILFQHNQSNDKGESIIEKGTSEDLNTSDIQVGEVNFSENCGKNVTNSFNDSSSVEEMDNSEAGETGSQKAENSNTMPFIGKARFSSDQRGKLQSVDIPLQDSQDNLKDFGEIREYSPEEKGRVESGVFIPSLRLDSLTGDDTLSDSVVSAQSQANSDMTSAGSRGESEVISGQFESPDYENVMFSKEAGLVGGEKEEGEGTTDTGLEDIGKREEHSVEPKKKSTCREDRRKNVSKQRSAKVEETMESSWSQKVAAFDQLGDANVTSSGIHFSIDSNSSGSDSPDEHLVFPKKDSSVSRRDSPELHTPPEMSPTPSQAMMKKGGLTSLKEDLKNLATRVNSRSPQESMEASMETVDRDSCSEDDDYDDPTQVDHNTKLHHELVRQLRSDNDFDALPGLTHHIQAPSVAKTKKKNTLQKLFSRKKGKYNTSDDTNSVLPSSGSNTEEPKEKKKSAPKIFNLRSRSRDVTEDRQKEEDTNRKKTEGRDRDKKRGTITKDSIVVIKSSGKSMTDVLSSPSASSVSSFESKPILTNSSPEVRTKPPANELISPSTSSISSSESTPTVNFSHCAETKTEDKLKSDVLTSSLSSIQSKQITNIVPLEATTPTKVNYSKAEVDPMATTEEDISTKLSVNLTTITSDDQNIAGRLTNVKECVDGLALEQNAHQGNSQELDFSPKESYEDDHDHDEDDNDHVDDDEDDDPIYVNTDSLDIQVNHESLSLTTINEEKGQNDMSGIDSPGESRRDSPELHTPPEMAPTPSQDMMEKRGLNSLKEGLKNLATRANSRSQGIDTLKTLSGTSKQNEVESSFEEELQERSSVIEEDVQEKEIVKDCDFPKLKAASITSVISDVAPSMGMQSFDVNLSEYDKEGDSSSSEIDTETGHLSSNSVVKFQNEALSTAEDEMYDGIEDLSKSTRNYNIGPCKNIRDLASIETTESDEESNQDLKKFILRRPEIRDNLTEREPTIKENCPNIPVKNKLSFDSDRIKSGNVELQQKQSSGRQNDDDDGKGMPEFTKYVTNDGSKSEVIVKAIVHSPSLDDPSTNESSFSKPCSKAESANMSSFIGQSISKENTLDLSVNDCSKDKGETFEKSRENEPQFSHINSEANIGLKEESHDVSKTGKKFLSSDLDNSMSCNHTPLMNEKPIDIFQENIPSSGRVKFIDSVHIIGEKTKSLYSDTDLQELEKKKADKNDTDVIVSKKPGLPIKPVVQKRISSQENCIPIDEEVIAPTVRTDQQSGAKLYRDAIVKMDKISQEQVDMRPKTLMPPPKGSRQKSWNMKVLQRKFSSSSSGGSTPSPSVPMTSPGFKNDVKRGNSINTNLLEGAMKELDDFIDDESMSDEEEEWRGSKYDRKTDAKPAANLQSEEREVVEEVFVKSSVPTEKSERLSLTEMFEKMDWKHVEEYQWRKDQDVPDDADSPVELDKVKDISHDMDGNAELENDNYDEPVERDSNAALVEDTYDESDDTCVEMRRPLTQARSNTASIESNKYEDVVELDTDVNKLPYNSTGFKVKTSLENEMGCQNDQSVFDIGYEDVKDKITDPSQFSIARKEEKNNLPSARKFPFPWNKKGKEDQDEVQNSSENTQLRHKNDLLTKSHEKLNEIQAELAAKRRASELLALTVDKPVDVYHEIEEARRSMMLEAMKSTVTSKLSSSSSSKSEDYEEVDYRKSDANSRRNSLNPEDKMKILPLDSNGYEIPSKTLPLPGENVDSIQDNTQSGIPGRDHGTLEEVLEEDVEDAYSVPAGSNSEEEEPPIKPYSTFKYPRYLDNGEIYVNGPIAVPKRRGAKKTPRLSPSGEKKITSPDSPDAGDALGSDRVEKEQITESDSSQNKVETEPQSPSKPCENTSRQSVSLTEALRQAFPDLSLNLDQSRNDGNFYNKNVQSDSSKIAQICEPPSEDSYEVITEHRELGPSKSGENNDTRSSPRREDDLSHPTWSAVDIPSWRSTVSLGSGSLHKDNSDSGTRSSSSSDSESDDSSRTKKKKSKGLKDLLFGSKKNLNDDEDKKSDTDSCKLEKRLSKKVKKQDSNKCEKSDSTKSEKSDSKVKKIESQKVEKSDSKNLKKKDSKKLNKSDSKSGYKDGKKVEKKNSDKKEKWKFGWGWKSKDKNKNEPVTSTQNEVRSNFDDDEFGEAVYNPGSTMYQDKAIVIGKNDVVLDPDSDSYEGILSIQETGKSWLSEEIKLGSTKPEVNVDENDYELDVQEITNKLHHNEDTLDKTNSQHQKETDHTGTNSAEDVSELYSSPPPTGVVDDLHAEAVMRGNGKTLRDMDRNSKSKVSTKSDLSEYYSTSSTSARSDDIDYTVHLNDVFQDIPDKNSKNENCSKSLPAGEVSLSSLDPRSANSFNPAAHSSFLTTSFHPMSDGNVSFRKHENSIKDSSLIANPPSSPNSPKRDTFEDVDDDVRKNLPEPPRSLSNSSAGKRDTFQDIDDDFVPNTSSKPLYNDPHDDIFEDKESVELRTKPYPLYASVNKPTVNVSKSACLENSSPKLPHDDLDKSKSLYAPDSSDKSYLIPGSSGMDTIASKTITISDLHSEEFADDDVIKVQEGIDIAAGTSQEKAPDLSDLFTEVKIPDQNRATTSDQPSDSDKSSECDSDTGSDSSSSSGSDFSVDSLTQQDAVASVFHLPAQSQSSLSDHRWKDYAPLELGKTGMCVGRWDSSFSL